MLFYGREAYVMSNYNVVFEGTISNGYKFEDVKRNLAVLFKIDGKKVDLLFAKPQVVLKKGVDYDSALKYRKAILETGAMCNVKKAVLPSVPLPVEETTPSNPNVQALQQTGPPAIPTQPPISATEETANINSGQSDATSAEGKQIKGVGDIIAGVVLIGIGFTFGGSVFLGNPGALDYFFDGLGIFWIGRGIYKMVR
jgi:hypothetical protein